MWLDVVDLRDYYETPLGQTTRRMIRRRIRSFWPDTKGLRVAGLGYATPFLNQFKNEAERTIALMPAAQGVLHWPIDGKGLTTLVDEAELPLPDVSIDRFLLIHDLEHTHQLQPLMREIWRVLTGGGRLLVVVPNRTGIWSRLERTPYGHGHPYTVGQITRLLKDTMFTPMGHSGALFMPPSRSRMLLAGAPAWEKIGLRWFKTFGGVVIVEAGKQIYASPHGASSKRERLYIPLTNGANSGRIIQERNGGKATEKLKGGYTPS